MNKRYLLISDVDDTLLGDDPALDRFARWHAQVRDEVALVYASGRFPDSLFRSIHRTALPEPDALIGGVGTEIRTYPQLEALCDWQSRISQQWDAQAVRERLADRDELEPQPAINQSRFKVSYYLEDADDHKLHALSRLLREASIAADLIYSSGKDLDVVPAGVNKGSAGAFLAEHWGIPVQRVMAAGNSENDAALLAQGFRGIVVANAEPGLKEAEAEHLYVANAGHADGVREGVAHWTDLPAEPDPDAEPAACVSLFDLGERQAMEMLRRCRAERGFLASTTEHANYRRIWGRDSGVIGLAALLSGETDLIEAVRDTLLTLTEYQGPHGEIPSNVDPDADRVSYGGTAGRVDADLWYLILAGQYWRATGDDELLARLAPALERTRFLLGCWEFNGRGLLYIPPTGDWADEYLQSGYVLYDQLLYLRALWEVAAIHAHRHGGADHALDEKIARLRHLIRANYWLFVDGDPPDDVYHRVLYEHGRKAAEHADGRYWMSFFAPTGYGFRFDALANVLASLLGVADDAQRESVDRYLEERTAGRNLKLLPAFHPVITPRDEAWDDLQVTFSHRFKNQPHQYHNGGLWPMVTGFYAADLAQRGERDRAQQHLRAIHEANAMTGDEHGWLFPEFVHGRDLTPGGTRRMAWSAAAAILADRALQGTPVFRDDTPDAPDAGAQHEDPRP